MEVKPRVEFQIGGTWTDVTSDVYLRDGLRISYGRRSEGAQVDHGRCTFTLNNRHGRYSPRNAMSPYYGLIGRNTPVRISAAGGTTELHLYGSGSDRATTPDTAALDITGDIDVRIDLTLDDWTPAAHTELIGKYLITGNQRSWALFLTTGGYLQWRWSPDGTTTPIIHSTAPVAPPTSGRLALRVTMDVDNGSGGYTVRFYTAESLTAGTWTQLGTSVVTSGVASIYASTAPLQVGDIAGLGFTGAIGRVHAAQVRSGIGGTIVANPTFRGQPAGATSITDSAGRTWTLQGGAEFAPGRHIRFVGEISAWPVRWHPSGADVWVSVEASGIIRRLRQGAKPLASTLRRRLPSRRPVAYWPMEEDRGATAAYSPIAGVPPLRVAGLDFAAADGPPGSSALPQIAPAGGFTGVVPGGAPGEWHVEFVYYVDAIPVPIQWFFQVFTTGGASRIQIMVWNEGEIQVVYENPDGVTDMLVMGAAPDFAGTWSRFYLRATPSGANTRLEVGWTTIGGGGYVHVLTYPGAPGRVRSIAVPNQFHEDLADFSIGHIAVFDTVDVNAFNLGDTGFAKETAAWRVERLGLEEKVPVTIDGPEATSTLMGPQRPATLLDLLQEAADADGGILAEDRAALALRLRTRETLYNQPAALALDYAQPGLAPPLEPTEDDDVSRNDVTVTRPSGSSARAVLESGPLSVQPPPAGIGVYDEAVTVNLWSDAQLPDQAGWRLHLGTWDEPRYPSVRVALHTAPHLADAVTALELLDRITIANPPVWLPPGAIDLLAEGWTEELGEYTWDITFACSPARPWDVGVRDDAVRGRRDTAGSQLAATATAAATTLSVVTTSGPQWTTAAADLPFTITVGGEEMTVTAVTGTGTAQTMTVVRAVNGISKGHAAGTAVRLARPAVRAL